MLKNDKNTSKPKPENTKNKTLKDECLWWDDVMASHGLQTNEQEN